MRTFTLIALLAACAGDDDSTPTIYDCDMLSKAVTQRHGTCRIAYDPNAPFMDGCTWTIDAYCLPDGLPASCPSGWATSCDEPTPNVLVNCGYFSGTGCTVVVPNQTVEYDYVQTLNGVDGIGVLANGSDATKCEFRACNPL